MSNWRRTMWIRSSQNETGHICVNVFVRMQCVSEFNVIVACSSYRTRAPVFVFIHFSIVGRLKRRTKETTLCPEHTICTVRSYQLYMNVLVCFARIETTDTGMPFRTQLVIFVSFHRIHAPARSPLLILLTPIHRIHFVFFFRNYSEYQIYKTNTFSERFG